MLLAANYALIMIQVKYSQRHFKLRFSCKQELAKKPSLAYQSRKLTEGSDKPFSDKGRKISEETLPGTSGSAGKSGCGKKSSGKTKTSDTDKENKPKVPCSKLATLFKNVKKSYPLTRVMIYNVEVQSSQRKDTEKWLPGTFRVMDSSGWGYLVVYGKAKGKIFKKGQTIEISNVKAINKEELWCDAGSVKSSSEPVQMLDCVVNKMKQEEKFATLSEIRKRELIKKAKVIIWKVGELQKRYISGEPYDFRELKVKASRSAKDVETLEAYNLPARFRFKEKQEVKVASVKYHKRKKKFQTSGDCLVETTAHKEATKSKPTSGSAGDSVRSKTPAGKPKTSAPKEATKSKPRCSKISTLFKNVDNTYEMIRVRICDVEEGMSMQKDNNTQLPGVFRVYDNKDWGYLKVFGRPKKKIFQPGNSVEVFKVKADIKRELICDSQDVRMSSKSVKSSISIEKMEKEEELPTLRMIRKGDGFKKTKLKIDKVGKKKKKDRFDEFTEVIDLKVRNDGRQTKTETLESAATFDYKRGQEVKVRVKYNRDEEKFQTSNHCLPKTSAPKEATKSKPTSGSVGGSVRSKTPAGKTKITDQDSAVKKKPCLQDESVDEKDLQVIAPKIANDRKTVVRNLGLENNKIAIIEADCDKEGQGGIQEKAFQLLLKWRNCNGQHATKRILSEALRVSDFRTSRKN
ncbi:hypothetical protein BSL78_22728 [Apostichopus japonicus]|uniref:Death domain-containing protein n=1 Tax=Stichopus japonicus TaxID=307972 RepID=A0A2G8JXN1_STIJA|nr:hypothetical protein BSL78_22728 [Apostichopus japonicus]